MLPVHDIRTSDWLDDKLREKWQFHDSMRWRHPHVSSPLTDCLQLKGCSRSRTPGILRNYKKYGGWSGEAEREIFKLVGLGNSSSSHLFTIRPQVAKWRREESEAENTVRMWAGETRTADAHPAPSWSQTKSHSDLNVRISELPWATWIVG